MIEFTSEEIAKLPKWAQTKVSLLGRRLEEARAARQAVLDNAPTRISIGRKAINEHDENSLRYLPTDRVTFSIGGRDSVEVSTDQHDPLRLNVYLNTTRHELHIMPTSSNTLQIVTVPR